MLRIYFLSLIAIIFTPAIYAQNTSDSIMSQKLNEVVVKATRRIEKGDTLSVIPSVNQRKFSMNGFELFRSMMLPGLRVNTVSGEMSLSSGESVMVLIDGRPVDRQHILSLRPKEVARIEYIQNPGAEYGYDSSLGAVINIVMQKRSDGYAATVLLNNAVTTANGQNFAFGKYTNGNSEYAISFNSDYTSLSRRRIDNNNIYRMSDDAEKHIVFKGMDTPLKYTDNTLQLEYDNYVPGKHIFDVTFKGVFYHSPERGYAQQVTENGVAAYSQMTRPYEKYISPRLTIYYKRFLTKSSSITANAVGNYRHTDYHYNIFETTTENFDYDSPTYSYGTVSDRQSYIGEVKYANKFNRKFSLNVGARAAYSYTSNNYVGKASSSDRLHNTNLYAYTSASGYFGKLFYSAGMGVSGRITDQNDRRMDKWMFRPELQLSYRLNGWRFTIKGVMLQNSPSLSEMADTEFRINSFEIKRGNPNLTDWWKYRTSFRLNKKFGSISLQNTLSYTDAHNPVKPFVSRQTDNGTTVFITSFGNQDCMSVLTDNLTLDMGVNDNLTFSGGVNYNFYRSKGSSYSHHLANWQFNFAADWYSGHWNVGINWRSSEKSLSGESYSYISAYNNVYVNYIIGNQWRIGLIGQHLFCKNGPTFKEDLRSRYVSKYETTIVPAQGNMIMITAAWNFSAGKQRKEAKIDMHNSDNESGIFK